MLIRNSTAIWLLAFSLAGTSASNADGTDAVSFQTDIRPILSNHCFACHGPDEHDRQAGVRLDTADGLRDVLDPDDWQSGLLVARIRSVDPDTIMPPPELHKPLGDDQKAMLEKWVAAGAPFEQHWSFVPPVRHELPASFRVAGNVSGAAVGSVDRIDSWINAGLANAGLTPNGPADRRSLARRVALDLTGMPPDVQRVDRFVADDSPGAYERFIDDLLASPRYGEHVARYWLDLVRYGDTHGLHLDNYREMWPYRDWVIAAINDNLPLDQFITEQLAGDLLPDATMAQKVASGFNRLNVSTNEGGSIYDEVFARNVMDRTNAFGTVFLGLTTGCAVCHDHKFDPISQADYYSLSAFFNSIDGRALDENVKDHAPSMAVPSPDQTRQLAEIETELTSLDQQIAGPLTDVDAAQLVWEQSLSQPADTISHDLKPTSATATSGTRLRIDEYVVAIDGEPSNQDTITIQSDLPAGSWALLRLHAIADADTGRAGVASNGNAVLSELTIRVRDGESEDWRPIPVRRADANIEQAGPQFAIEKAVDGKMGGNTGWAIAGHESPGDRVAWFTVDPIVAGSGCQIQVELAYQSVHAKHLLASVRLSVHASDRELPDSDQIGVGDVHVAGPFEVESSGAGFGKNFANENAASLDVNAKIRSGARQYRWQHRGDFTAAIVNKLPSLSDRSSVSVVHQSITAPSAQTVDLMIGTDDGHIVWLNGKKLREIRGPHSLEPLRETVPLELTAGVNDLFITHVNYDGDATLTFALRSPRAPVPRRLATMLRDDREGRSPTDQASIRKYYREVACDHPAWVALGDMKRGMLRLRDDLRSQIPTTLVWKELAQPRPAHILHRGQYDAPGNVVGRATPSFLPPLADPRVADADANVDATVDRLDLARWLTRDDHPLTSRVAVNRFWQQCFGTGLVKTSEDFGSQGSPPSHPRLLDELALDFIDGGWDVKALLKRMVMTDAYRRSAAATPAMLQIDPGNRLLARGPRHRLDAETLRDQALLVSGLLVESMGGPSVKPPQPAGLWEAVGYSGSNTVRFEADTGDKALRRSVYTFWKRTSAPAVLSTLDAPSRESCIARRERTNTPLQALLLLNEPQMMLASRAVAEGILGRIPTDVDDPDESAAIIACFRQITTRDPDDRDCQTLTALLTELTRHYGNDPAAATALVGRADARLAAWTIIASTILNSDEVLCK